MTTVAARPAGVHPEATTTGPRRRFGARTRRVLGFAGFAVLAYAPVLLTHPGQVEADTKTYLYLDPGRLLSQAASMWDPSIGLGTVSHQTIGYLFPMGPFYWVLEQALGVPSWVAQRLWLGTLLFAAGVGVWFLFRTIGVRGAGVAVGVLAYTFSPYVLQYSARFSVILGPWAALPWLVALVALALRRGGWLYPALFALTIQLVGSVNATALVFAGLGPALWIPYAVWIRHDAGWRRAWQVLWRTGLLTLVTSLWWIAGLWAQGGYGLDVLRYTETVETVSLTSYANEIWRGLGYWFFYFRDLIGLWNDAVGDYTQRPALILLSFAVPALALLSAAVVRWRDRAFFVLLALVGMVIAVGASPYDDPSLVGSAFKAFATSSSVGLALRSTSRAAPLLVLALAALLAVGVSALVDALVERGRAGLATAAAVFVGVLVVANSPGVWGGRLYSRYLERDEEVPAYWQDALRDVDARPHDTRVLALPGSDFAAYRWGVTIDPIEPGLIDRPYVARELVPWGSEASAGFLEAVDRRIQTGELDPDAIAPLARLLGAGDVLLRLDLQTERYNLVRSEDLWRLFTDDPPAGLDPPRVFGDRIPGEPAIPRIDEETIAGGEAPEPPPVAVFGVRDALPIVRATTTEQPLVVAGDADGIVDAAAVGLLDRDRLVVYSGSYADDPEGLRAQIDRGATLVVTDTNRRRSHRWTGARDNSGHTEQPGEAALSDDPRDARLGIFPGAGLETMTVADQRGVEAVVASDYGLAGLAPQPGFRATRAVDGDPATAWQVGGERRDVEGQRIRVTLDEPITTDRVNLLQPVRGPRGRWIEDATITFDGDDAVSARLGPASRDESGDGQVVRFSERTFRTFELEIDRIREAPRDEWKLSPRPGDSVRWHASYVGLAEIRLRDSTPGAADARVDEYVRMPTDLLDAAGTASLDRPLVLTMTRDGRAVDPQTDSELSLQRVFTLPTGRGFDVSGTARLNAGAPDDAVDRALGIAGAAAGGITVTSSDHLFGSLEARGSSAFDGDPTTAWTTPLGDIVGQSVRVETAAPVTVDRLDLRIANDDHHSVPTRLTITTEDGTRRSVRLPDVGTRDQRGSVAATQTRFDPLTGRRFTVRISGARANYQTDYATLQPNAMPVGIAELGLPGVARAPMPAELPSSCRDDLLTVDGAVVPARLVGSTADAARGAGLRFEPCGADAIPLDAGRHEVRVAQGIDTGIDVDRLAWASAPGGAPSSIDAIRAARPPIEPAPAARVLDEDATTATVRVDDAREPFWLVLGQSLNPGWTASADGEDLGEARLVDGFANGWLVRPPADGGPVTIELRWTPQRTVDAAILVSVAGVLACLAIVVVGLLRARRRGKATAERQRLALASPFSVAGTTPSAARVVVTGVLTGVTAGALIQPWCGLLVGGLVVFVLVRPRWRWLLSLFPAAALVVCGLYVAWNQVRRDWATDINWPTRFWRLRTLGWLAMLTLAADAVVGLVRRAEPTAEPAERDLPEEREGVPAGAPERPPAAP